MWFRTLLCFSLLFCLTESTSALAQGQPQEPPPPGSMSRELGLNADQAKRFEAVLQAERTAMDKLREERQRIHNNTREKLAAFLTAEQLKRFEAMRPGNAPVRQREGRPPQGQ